MRKKRRLSGLLLIFVLLLAASPWMVRWIQHNLAQQNMTLELKREAVIPFSGNWSVLPGEKGVYVVRSNEITYFQWDQTNDWGFATETLAPVVGANRTDLFLLESNPGYLLRVNEQGYMLYQQATNRSVESITVDKAGYALVRHPVESRLLPFSILDPEGRTMGSLLLTEGEVLNTLVASEHNRVYVVVIRLTANSYESVLLGYDLQGALQTSKGFPDQLVVEVMMTRAGDVAVLTNNRLVLVGPTMEEVWQHPLEPFYLAANDGHGRWVLAHHREKFQEENATPLEGETVLSLFLLEEGSRRVMAVEEKVTDMMAFEHLLLLRSARKLRVLNEEGTKIDERMFLNEIEDAFLLRENYIALLFRGQIAFYQLRREE